MVMLCLMEGELIGSCLNVSLGLSWCLFFFLLRESKYSAPLSQFLWGSADVELFELTNLVFRLNGGDFIAAFPH